MDVTFKKLSNLGQLPPLGTLNRLYHSAILEEY